MKVFSVFDSKAEAYLSPFYMRSKGEAVRAFADSVNDKGSPLGKYPQDFVLFELGSFDDSTAKFDLLPSPISIGVGIEFIKQSYVDSRTPDLKVVD